MFALYRIHKSLNLGVVFLGELKKKTCQKRTIIFVMSVCPSVRRNNLIPNGRIFMKFDISKFFWKSVKKNLMNIRQE